MREKNKNTNLAAILSGKFIIFDEYIDSGKTLVNSIKFFHLFAENLSYRVLCYLSKFSSDAKNPIVSLNSLDNEDDCYQRGVYPFENRIDLVGYFYYVDRDNLQKVFLEEVSGDDVNKQDPGSFLNLIYSSFRENLLLRKIKNSAKIKPVADYINYYHLIQYFLFIFSNSNYKQKGYKNRGKA